MSGGDSFWLPLGGGGSGAVDGTALTNDQAAVKDVYEQWGTETLTFSGLTGTPASIDASLIGNIECTVANRRVGWCRVQVSLDGGTSWSSGNVPVVELNSSSNIYRSLVGSSAVVAGTPTGSVIVRAQLQQSALGTAGDLKFNNGYLTARVFA